MTLAEKLLELRTAKGLSQGDLADKLEVSRQSVSKWETGQSVPDLEKIIKLADLFGVSVDDLVREEGRPQPEPSTPQVVYVEKKWEPSPAQNLQILGIVCEAIGAAPVVLGLMGMGVFLLLGVALVILGLPLLLCVKHPFLIDGWLLTGLSFLVWNPNYVRIDGSSVLLAIRHGYITWLTLIPLVRDILILILAARTWRLFRKEKSL